MLCLSHFPIATALIYAEIIGYHGFIYESQFQKISLRLLLLSNFDLEKLRGLQLKEALAVWAARYLAPPIIIAGLYFLGYTTVAITVAILYAAYLAGHIALWPSRYRQRKEEEREWQDHIDRLSMMIKVYSLCSPPVINPTMLREELLKVTEVGAVFQGAVFAILDRIIQRDRAVFLPFGSR